MLISSTVFALSNFVIDNIKMSAQQIALVNDEVNLLSYLNKFIDLFINLFVLSHVTYFDIIRFFMDNNTVVTNRV